MSGDPITEMIEATPASIGSGLARVVRFPPASRALGSPVDLASAMKKFLTKYVELDTRALNIITAFVLATWFIDCFEVAPVLNLFGPPREVSLVMRLLSCLCYHPALLGDVDVAALGTIPAGWGVTLLINQPELGNRVMKALTASTRRHFYLARGTRTLDIFGARALHGDSSCMEVGLNVFLNPASRCFPTFTQEEERAATEQFQSALLADRLSRRKQVQAVEVGTVAASLGVEDQLRTWLAPLPDDSELRESVLAAFAERKQDFAGTRFEDPKCLVAEAALLFCHRKTTEHFFVGELAEKVNDLLAGRHAGFKLEDRKIGSVLKELGIQAHRVTNGFRVPLDEAMRKHIHRIAAAYQVLSARPEAARCAHCKD